MLPGPVFVRRCQHCEGVFSQPTILSGNTFGARYWTDGKREAPMLPETPSLVKCPHCGALLWLAEQPGVDRCEHPEGDADAPTFARPGAGDYLGLLDGAVFDPQRERYLRIWAWWTGNDRRRRLFGCLRSRMTPRERRNLDALSRLLDPADQSSRLMQAEICRELGRFQEAKALLAHPLDEGFEQAVRVLENLIARRDARLREIKYR